VSVVQKACDHSTLHDVPFISLDQAAWKLVLHTALALARSFMIGVVIVFLSNSFIGVAYSFDQKNLLACVNIRRQPGIEGTHVPTDKSLARTKPALWFKVQLAKAALMLHGKSRTARILDNQHKVFNVQNTLGYVVLPCWWCADVHQD
jgi:hypothetical protein